MPPQLLIYQGVLAVGTVLAIYNNNSKLSIVLDKKWH